MNKIVIPILLVLGLMILPACSNTAQEPNNGVVNDAKSEDRIDINDQGANGKKKFDRFVKPPSSALNDGWQIGITSNLIESTETAAIIGGQPYTYAEVEAYCAENNYKCKQIAYQRLYEVNGQLEDIYGTCAKDYPSPRLATTGSSLDTQQRLPPAFRVIMGTGATFGLSAGTAWFFVTEDPLPRAMLTGSLAVTGLYVGNLISAFMSADWPNDKLTKTYLATLISALFNVENEGYLDSFRNAMQDRNGFCPVPAQANNFLRFGPSEPK